MKEVHYKVIADIVRRVLQGTTYFHPMVDLLCSYFSDDNPVFDEHSFREACREKPKEIEVEVIEEKSPEKKLQEYQNDTWGYKAAINRMNEKFEHLNEKIKKEKNS